MTGSLSSSQGSDQGDQGSRRRWGTAWDGRWGRGSAVRQPLAEDWQGRGRQRRWGVGQHGIQILLASSRRAAQLYGDAFRRDQTDGCIQVNPAVGVVLA